MHNHLILGSPGPALHGCSGILPSITLPSLRSYLSSWLQSDCCQILNFGKRLDNLWESNFLMHSHTKRHKLLTFLPLEFHWKSSVLQIHRCILRKNFCLPRQPYIQEEGKKGWRLAFVLKHMFVGLLGFLFYDLAGNKRFSYWFIGILYMF